jgi:hypothetical protein
MLGLRGTSAAELAFDDVYVGPEEVLLEGDPSNSEAFKMIGLLFGHGILTPRQLPVVKKEWLTPSYDDFRPRTMWSYNACICI